MITQDLASDTSNVTDNYRDDVLIKQDHIFGIFNAIRITHTLYIAHELKLFSMLAKQALSLQEIAKQLKIEDRAAQALLSMCMALNLIKLDNDKYTLTKVSKHYLLPESPYYIGALIDMAIHQVISYDHFKKSFLLNTSQVYDGQDLFERNEEDPNATEFFTRAMHAKSMTAASIWPQAIDLSPYNTMLDIAGGSGAHAIQAVKAWPSLQAIVYERPLVGKIAQEYIHSTHLGNRIKVYEGNMWEAPFPQADLHFYCDVLHDWPLKKSEFLINKSYQSLPPKGRIIIHELLFNDQKSGPFPTAIYNVIMLLWTQGQQYSSKEMRDLLQKVGFKEIQIIPTGFGDWSLVTGVK